MDRKHELLPLHCLFHPVLLANNFQIFSAMVEKIFTGIIQRCIPTCQLIVKERTEIIILFKREVIALLRFIIYLQAIII